MSHWHRSRLNRSLGPYAAAWDALCARIFRPNPMFDSRFVDSLLQHFGEGREWLCYLGDAAAPRAMCVLRAESPFIWSTFLPSQAQIALTLIDHRDLVPGLIQALPKTVLELRLLCNDPDFGDLSEPDNRKQETRDHALTASIPLNGTFDAYWARRPKKLVQNIDRYLRRATKDGLEVRSAWISEEQGIEAAVARYAALESAGWKGKIGTAVHLEHSQGHFYLDVLKRFASKRGAEIYELWFGDQLAASRLAICHGNATVMLKTTYDESLAQYAPGRLLLRQVIEHKFASASGGHIEFYTDANNDMLAWSDSTRWIRHVTYHRGRLGYSAQRAARIGLSIVRGMAGKWWHAAPAPAPANDSVEVYKHPAEMPADAMELFEAAECIAIELGPTWFTVLVDSVFANQSHHYFYVLRRAGRPIAIFPVLVTKTRHGHQVKSLANYYSALYDLALAPTTKAADLVVIIRRIISDHKSVASFQLAPMDPTSITYRRVLNAFWSAGLVPFQFFCFGNWYLTVNTPWHDYLASRDGALRSTIRRMIKKFSAHGGTLEIVQGTNGALDRAIAAYETVYAGSWKVPEPYPHFMSNLIRACAAKGWLRLGIAWLKDVPIAAQVWIVANSKASIYKLAYQDAYKAYAPGTLLTSALMQHCIEHDRVQEVDYLIGDDPYKKTWMTSRRERWGIVFYNTGTLAGATGLLREAAGRTIRAMR